MYSILIYLRIDLNLFSVHEEINSKMLYTPLRNPRTEQKIVINPYKLIPN